VIDKPLMRVSYSFGLRVTLDVDSWALEYGVEPHEVGPDLLSYLQQLSDLPGLRAAETTVTITTIPPRCTTTGCRKPATGEMTYSLREDGDKKTIAPVCDECGEMYQRRPTLRVTVGPLRPDGGVRA
jgi:hypothetical protein